MSEDRFGQLVARMEAGSVASAPDLVGCGATEIAALETKYQLRLPRTYRRFLEVMGHRSGRLFASDHIAVRYRDVLAMTSEIPAAWAVEGPQPPLTFALPADTLLIAGRLSQQFEFIRCVGQDDSPVWYFNDWEWRIRQSQPSILAWLESWCDEALRAVADGYFDAHPKGAGP